MKIVFFVRSLDVGGTEKQLVTLATALHKRGTEFSIVTFYRGGAFHAGLERMGVKVLDLRKRGRWDIIFFLARMIGVMRREQPSILYSFLTVPNLLAVLIKPFLPSTRIAWGIRASNMDLSKYDRLSRLSSFIECRMARFADLIVVNSNAGRDHHVRRGFPAEKMLVVHNGIDTTQFRFDPEGRQLLRSEWGIKEHEALIGVVARLDPMKDHPTFLKAAALLSEEFLHVRFMCVGDGPHVYKEKLSELTKALGLSKKLIWAGERSDMRAIYSALDIVCSSSSFGEGFPNAVGEAMSCERPCVATDVGDTALLLGETGTVVPPRDPRALAGALKDVVIKISQKKDLNRPYGNENARQRVEECFSQEHLVAKTKVILRDLQHRPPFGTTSR